MLSERSPKNNSNILHFLLHLSKSDCFSPRLPCSFEVRQNRVQPFLLRIIRLIPAPHRGINQRQPPKVITLRLLPRPLLLTRKFLTMLLLTMMLIIDVHCSRLLVVTLTPITVAAT